MQNLLHGIDEILLIGSGSSYVAEAALRHALPAHFLRKA